MQFRSQCIHVYVYVVSVRETLAKICGDALDPVRAISSLLFDRLFASCLFCPFRLVTQSITSTHCMSGYCAIRRIQLYTTRDLGREVTAALTSAQDATLLPPSHLIIDNLPDPADDFITFTNAVCSCLVKGSDSVALAAAVASKLYLDWFMNDEYHGLPVGTSASRRPHTDGIFYARVWCRCHRMSPSACPSVAHHSSCGVWRWCVCVMPPDNPSIAFVQLCDTPPEAWYSVSTTPCCDSPHLALPATVPTETHGCPAGFLAVSRPNVCLEHEDPVDFTHRLCEAYVMRYRTARLLVHDAQLDVARMQGNEETLGRSSALPPSQVLSYYLACDVIS